VTPRRKTSDGKLADLVKSFGSKGINSAAYPGWLKSGFGGEFLGIVVVKAFFVFFDDKTVPILFEMLKPTHIVLTRGKYDQVKLHPVSSQI
jgi:hypothetical protein